MSVSTATFDLPYSSCPVTGPDNTKFGRYCCEDVAKPTGGNVTFTNDADGVNCHNMSVLALYMCENIQDITKAEKFWEPAADAVGKGCKAPAPATGEKVEITIGGADCTVKDDNSQNSTVPACCKVAGGTLDDVTMSCSNATADYFTWCVKSSGNFLVPPTVACTGGSSSGKNGTASSTTKNGTDASTNGTNTNGNAPAATTSSGSRSTVAKLGFAVYALLALQALL